MEDLNIKPLQKEKDNNIASMTPFNYANMLYDLMSLVIIHII